MYEVRASKYCARHRNLSPGQPESTAPHPAGDGVSQPLDLTSLTSLLPHLVQLALRWREVADNLRDYLGGQISEHLRLLSAKDEGEDLA